MHEFDQSFREAQQRAQALTEVAIAIQVLFWSVAIGAAIWFYLDAENRGRSGIMAACTMLVAGFLGIPALLIVLGLWILLRPDKVKGVGKAAKSLPPKLSPDLAAGPSSQEFLQELEDERS